MKLKLDRDDARLLLDVFLDIVYDLIDAKFPDDSGYNTIYSIINHTLIDRVHNKLLRRLLSKAVKISIELEADEIIALYRWLVALPIWRDKVYHWIVRQKICDQLHSAIPALIILQGQKAAELAILEDPR